MPHCMCLRVSVQEEERRAVPSKSQTNPSRRPELESVEPGLGGRRSRRIVQPLMHAVCLSVCASRGSRLRRPETLATGLGHNAAVASYSLNQRAVARARRLIDARQYVLDSDWGDAQPRAAEENAFLESHSWEEYAEWHLGLTDGAEDGTKARHAFVYGDFRRIHRTALIACVYRAAEWRHKEIELAAHDLLQYLDAATS